MNWVVLIWSVIGGVCFVLAVVHGQVWLRTRPRPADAAFALISASVSCVALLELAMMHAQTPRAFMSLLGFYYLPLFTGTIGLVHFVWAYFGAGRRWLGWVVIALRGAVTAAGVLSCGKLHFEELFRMSPTSLLGVEVLAPDGVPNPWMLVAPLSVVLLIVFFLDAIHSLWRRGSRREAVVLAVALALFAAMAMAISIIAVWFKIGMPLVVAACFAPVVLLMAIHLGRDLVRAARLSRDLVETEGRLTDARARLSLAAEAANAGFWSMDPVTRLYRPAPQALRMLGLPEGHALPVDELALAIPPEDRPRVAAALDAAIRSEGRMVSVEYRFIDRAGGVHWLASFGGRGDGTSGTKSQLTGLTIDITERKRIEEALSLQRQQLEHLSRVVTIGELSDALAHELNQPLAIVMANAEAAQTLMRRGNPDLPELRQILDDIVAAVERAAGVIDRLRTLLRSTVPKREPVDLNALVGGILEFLRPDLVRRGVTVIPRLAPDLPWIQGERVPLEQVLINLIRNGCDAMEGNPPGERVLSVITRPSDGPLGRSSPSPTPVGVKEARGGPAVPSEHGILLLVEDLGPGLGLSPEQPFEAFHTTKSGSVGLGLSVCRAVVEAHGGSIRGENLQDRGARFVVALPVQESLN